MSEFFTKALHWKSAGTSTVANWNVVIFRIYLCCPKMIHWRVTHCMQHLIYIACVIKPCLVHEHVCETANLPRHVQVMSTQEKPFVCVHVLEDILAGNEVREQRFTYRDLQQQQEMNLKYQLRGRSRLSPTIFRLRY